MKVINLFGGPGTGKSTTAAGLFHIMKLAQLNVELVTEYPKDLVWQERFRTFKDQFYISAKQNHRQDVLRGKVDYIITDSPLPLALVYAPTDYYESFTPMIMTLYRSYDNINFFLQRSKEYNPQGRNQTEDEANQVAINIENLLVAEELKYTKLVANAEASQNIYQQVINTI